MVYSGILRYKYSEMTEKSAGTIHGAVIGGTVPEYPSEREKEYPSQ